MNKSEYILECLIENLNEGIHIVDNKGKTIYYNNPMAKIEGFKKEDVLGKKVYEYLKGMEDISTLMNALKEKKQYRDIIQHYSSKEGKNITSINTTIPVILNDNVVAAIEIARDMTQIRKLNEKVCKLENNSNKYEEHHVFKNIIGDSVKIRNEVNKAVRASLSNSSVLIYGETGTGKEVFAQSIHYGGIRKDKPFIPINCAAIPSALLEGMLFGTVKGSFTGAENKKGLFEEAHQGTVLLDEINSMEPYLQSKLLRVLQDGYIRPLGSNKIIDIDVRIIATLNEEPEKLISEGKLRKDFYYRLSVLRIDIPPLRERKEDIESLAYYFLSYYNKILSKSVKSIDKEVVEKFLQYNWPGNIRELKNVIESAMNMIDDSEILTKEFFENKIVQYGNDYDNTSYDGDMPLSDYLDCIEKGIIEKCLKKHSYNVSKTSKELKVSRQSLQYKLKKYNLLDK
ncbi:sensory box protein [Clostridium argentinense CDC 2741]|uniref:Sensory box protein n=1 Tax=Clostridium argentinense CDC 2741 TaxID=1418104 RepID=A0A0C1RAQ2_9CLOT|nr:sigma-54-dependent Fis family transcriptional regulator [Clostridium argentinense]HAG42603.1 sigma-54-dependent Fis family transcriptional regulator [Clostridium sp.]ARC84598.1 sigma-54-dependent Fis family transcriptional regulator [Clostridium argentinense]KIE47486.1 sensory box protein [Clostridium argentinense CDC 2741]NFF38618.1 sigma-54-dependent Fis family transcriptional regulator [Clostridium argentinense]NFP48843.1 sigma-54-dependent Fis family transcriptional regulator [Clostridi